VLVSSLITHTYVAMFTVEEVFTTTEFAHAALVAMELPLGRIVVVKLAFLAEVLSKNYFALFTTLIRRLYCVAIVALNILHSFCVDFMWHPRLLNLVLLC